MSDGRWLWITRKTIRGCEGRGDAQSPYLTRYTLLRTRLGSVYLHRFHRSDADVMHDHPWPFLAVILWRGYIEHTPSGSRRKWPGMILLRPAKWVHRVELPNGKMVGSLVITGPVVRSWGFSTRRGWQGWREYFKEMGCEE